MIYSGDETHGDDVTSGLPPAPEAIDCDEEYLVFVGTDMEGDDCIYVMKGAEYIASPELDVIVDELQCLLNAPKKA